MNRSLLALAFALTTAATGCGGSSNPPGEVAIYWGFVRNTAAGALLYDASDPNNAESGTCAESGVEYVRVTRLDGRDVDPQVFFDVQGVPAGAIPCLALGVHGVVFRVISAGTHTWTVTGYRTFEGAAIPVAQSSATFDVRPDRLSEVVVDVQPIQDDVSFTPAPWNATNSQRITCAESGIGEIDLFVDTFVGDSVVAQTVVGCGPVTFRLDRDDYYVRMQGFPSAAATRPTHDSKAPTNDCVDTLVTQLGPSGGGTTWGIDMRSVPDSATLCTFP